MHGVRSAAALAALIVVAGCGAAGSAGGTGGTGDTIPLRLGYFPNVTHAPAIVGVADGIFERALGDDVRLEPQVFNAGPEVVEAIFNGALDASYIGPNPAINAYARSGGEAIRIIAGSTSGGAALVVRDGIENPADLAGATLATPQLGNTQDVALRAWLAGEGLATDLEGGGDVAVTPQPNGQALQAFVAGAIDGAWVPEPWATRMVVEGDGHVLVDEADLWPGGAFVTTHLIVATSFLEQHPDVVRRLLEGHVEAVRTVNDDPAQARSVVAEAMASLTGSALPDEILEAAMDNLTYTVDPVVSSLGTSADHAVQMGLLEPVDLEGIYDLALLNEVLRDAGQDEISLP